MRKTTLALLTVLLMITMTLPTSLVGTPANDENTNHTSARADTCTSDAECPEGYICSADGVCEEPQTCDGNEDCPDGQVCEGGTCVDDSDDEYAHSSGEVNTDNDPLLGMNLTDVSMSVGGEFEEGYVLMVSMVISNGSMNVTASGGYWWEIAWLNADRDGRYSMGDGWTVRTNNPHGNDYHASFESIETDDGGCVTNEDCTDGQYCNENNECADDPSLDDLCTSDADCENGQICGAAGECGDPLENSENETDGNETNDGGGEPQYRNCSFEDMWSMMGDWDFNDLELMVCDEDTGEWVDADLDLDRPTSVEIGCDEEPTEEQLDASNFADLLNDHDEVLIRDGDETRLLSKGQKNTSVTLSPFLIAKYELSQVGSNDSDGLEEWSIYLDLDLDTAVGDTSDFDWNDMTVVWHTMVTYVFTDDSDDTSEDSEGRSNSTFTPRSETVYIISHSFLVSNSTGNDTEGVWGGSLSIEGIVSTGESGGAIIMQRTAIDTSGGGVDECGECWGMEVSIEPNDPDVGNIFLMEKVSYSSTMKSLGTTVITGGTLTVADSLGSVAGSDGETCCDPGWECIGGSICNGCMCVGQDDGGYSVSSSNFQFLYQEQAEYERSEGRNSTNAIASPAFGSITIWFETSVSSWSNSSWDHGGGLNLPFTSISNGSGTLIADSYVIWSVNLGGENDGEDLNSEDDPQWIYVSLGGTNDGNWMMSFGNGSVADATVCEHTRIRGASCIGSTVIGGGTIRDLTVTFDRLSVSNYSGLEEYEDYWDMDMSVYLIPSHKTNFEDSLDLVGAASAFDQKLVAVNSFVMSVDGGFVFSENLMFADFDNGMRVESIQIDMDEDGTVTNANIVKKEGCATIPVEDGGGGWGDPTDEEESSASGDVDITGLGDGADLMVIGGGALLAGIGISSILGRSTRALRRDGGQPYYCGWCGAENSHTTESCPEKPDDDGDGNPTKGDGGGEARAYDHNSTRSNNG